MATQIVWIADWKDYRSVCKCLWLPYWSLTQKYVNVNRPHTAFVSTLRALAARTAVPDKSSLWLCPCWPMLLNLGHMILSSLSPGLSFPVCHHSASELGMGLDSASLSRVPASLTLPYWTGYGSWFSSLTGSLPHWLYPAELGMALGSAPCLESLPRWSYSAALGRKACFALSPLLWIVGS